jgi:hypothetical protein
MMNSNDLEETRSKRGDQKANFGSRFIRFIVRLFLLILLGVSLGAAAYFGIPALYKDYIEPVQMNSQRITDLEDTLLQSQSDSRNRISELGDRLAEIEGQLVVQKEFLSEKQVEIENLQTLLKQQTGTIEDLQQLTERLDALQDEVQNTAEKVEFLTGEDAPTQRLGFQLQLVRVMELLTRARLLLTQNNFGLAFEEVQGAKQALENLTDVTHEEDAESIQQIVASLDSVLRTLPENPVIAADNLEISWNLLLTATEQEVITIE